LDSNVDSDEELRDDWGVMRAVEVVEEEEDG